MSTIGDLFSKLNDMTHLSPMKGGKKKPAKKSAKAAKKPVKKSAKKTSKK